LNQIAMLWIGSIQNFVLPTILSQGVLVQDGLSF
jgi:hypothetical protein